MWWAILIKNMKSKLRVTKIQKNNLVCILGDVTPESLTVTASVGDNVTLRVTQNNGESSELRWKHNGANVSRWNGQSNVTLSVINSTNAGIYECYRNGSHNQQRHALMRLIVRGNCYNCNAEKAVMHLHLQNISPIPTDYFSNGADTVSLTQLIEYAPQ